MVPFIAQIEYVISLLNVLTSVQEPDSGRVTRARGTTLGVLAQDDPLDPEASVREAVLLPSAGKPGPAIVYLR